MGFHLWVHNGGFKGVGSFENDLYSGMSENSSKFFTEDRDIWDRDEDIFFLFYASIRIFGRSCWFLFRIFDEPIWVAVLNVILWR